MKVRKSGNKLADARNDAKNADASLFQNDVVLYFKSYWKRGNVADNNFWNFNKLND